jgi:hypothetical protein
MKGLPAVLTLVHPRGMKPRANLVLVNIKVIVDVSVPAVDLDALAVLLRVPGVVDFEPGSLFERMETGNWLVRAGKSWQIALTTFYGKSVLVLGSLG